ncbi:DUF1289 domain-containing protein [Serratia ureilytica]
MPHRRRNQQCRGCRRTRAEIAAWPTAGDAEKRAIWRRRGCVSGRNNPQHYCAARFHVAQLSYM